MSVTTPANELLREALPILREYAQTNPKFFSTYLKEDQDPRGVHALIPKVEAHLAATESVGGLRVERTNILPAQSWRSIEEWRNANDAAWAERERVAAPQIISPAARTDLEAVAAEYLGFKTRNDLEYLGSGSDKEAYTKLLAILSKHLGQPGGGGAERLDGERLDSIEGMSSGPEWDDNGFWKMHVHGKWHTGNSVRQCIDAACAATKPERPPEGRE